jgi:hypothetical protein
MAKKKHLTAFEQQKLQKLKQAQYRNFFMEKVRNICTLIEDESLYHLIPQTELTMIYAWRGAPLKIQAAKDAKIQKRLIDLLGKYIKGTLLAKSIEVIPGSGRTISLVDYFTVCTAMESILGSENCVFPGKERFDAFIQSSDERCLKYEEEIHRMCQFVCWLFDDLTKKRLYTFYFDVEGMKEDVDIDAIDRKYKGNTGMMQKFYFGLDYRLHPKVMINTYTLDERSITINGEKRSAVQLGTILYPNRDTPAFIPYTLSPEQLNIRHSFSKLPILIYIQQHAVHRLMERTGSSTVSYCMMQFANVFIHPVIIPVIAGKRFLIEYRMNDIKIGYLLTELIDGILLVRTFLLLTNSSTPEGDRLARLTRLQKEDRTYLSLDNLRSLVNSDILDNETVCEIFRQTGCDPLLEFCRKAQSDPVNFWFLGVRDQEQPKTPLAELIVEYMKPSADNDEYVVGE